MVFIHDEACFSEDSVRERSKLYGFSDPLPVELFLWDCEIAAQLQVESEDFVLKGGAAAQLHLPIEMQRGSVDVDIVCPFTKDQIADFLSRIHARISSIAFEKFVPNRPKKEINMVTYLAKMPTLIPSERRKTREVKIDFLLEDLRLPNQTVESVETFAVKVKKLKCYSVSSLLGDKLLTLAENTIGITEAPSIPKQIYDVSVLSEYHHSKFEQFSEIAEVIEEVVPLEARYRGLKTTSLEALSDVERTMEKYGLLDTPDADSNIKRNITNFQQLYVSKSQKQPLYEWSTRALRIRFLSRLLKATIEGKTTAKDASIDYDSAVQTTQLLKTFTGQKIKTISNGLMDLADNKIPYFKSLKGKPLPRIYWQVVSQNNLKLIQDLVKNQST